MTGITHATALWYASRATGVVTLVLLTAVVVLGMTVNRQGRLPGLPRFAVTGLHRNISLLSVVFLAIHVVSAIADPYVTIGLAATVIPFASPYKPLWLGLGALSLDLIAALILTEPGPGPDEPARLARHPLARLRRVAARGRAQPRQQHRHAQRRAARRAHRSCVLAVCAALAWRLSRAARQIPRARRAATALSQVSAPAAVAPHHPGPGR